MVQGFLEKAPEIKRSEKVRKCAIFIFDGFADHEVSLIMAWLNTSSDFIIETFAAGGRIVTAMSGLRVCPHYELEKMDPEYFDLLLLPGGTQWEKGDNLEVFPLLLQTAGVKPIAAICGATLALADLGLLDNVPHTSNYPGYIEKFCPDYTGSFLYEHIPCVNAGMIITAGGVAIVDMAGEILQSFGIFQEVQARNWKELYQSGGQVQSFFEQ